MNTILADFVQEQIRLVHLCRFKTIKMFAIKAVLVSIVILASLGTGRCWFFVGSSEKSKESQEDVQPSPVVIKTVKFEMKTTDDEFLLAAQNGQDLSSLDYCHHRVRSVIYYLIYQRGVREIGGGGGGGIRSMLHIRTFIYYFIYNRGVSEKLDWGWGGGGLY